MRDIVVVGASAGGVEALIKLVRNLPPRLPAAVFVVLHVPAERPSVLPSILSRAGPLLASQPEDGEPIQLGHIYVAPPDHHLEVRRGRVHATRGPRENGYRPAVDTLFRTAAEVYGPRVVGIVLSGALDDGTAGLLAIKARGGIALVQDPETALFPDMPRSALEHVPVDSCLPVPELAQAVARLSTEQTPSERSTMTSSEPRQPELPDLDRAVQQSAARGAPSGLTCPDCGGALWERDEEGVALFTCHVGHRFSVEAMLARQSEALEIALWGAVRSLEEQAALSRRLAQRARENGLALAIERFEDRARSAEQHADVIRGLLMRDGAQAASTIPPNGPDTGEDRTQRSA
jgi:two-component system chemotaxis response regulator CheB